MSGGDKHDTIIRVSGVLESSMDRGTEKIGSTVIDTEKKSEDSKMLPT